ncbi:MAG TPA: S41 family peptidase [Solirubrobacterales bacterium]|nr:S41 family peptidase [Solirubrobacterales bacterium]
MIAALVAVAFVVGLVAGERVDPVNDAVVNVIGDGEGDPTSEAIDVIESDYFQEVDGEELETDSIRALVEQLKERYDDRFSHYFTPEEYDRFREGARFSGVGMAVNEVERGLRVATVYKRTPAKEAGIEPGDVITAVDGRSIVGESAEAATARIRGREGTQVTLTVVSRGERPREVTLTRREVDIPQVSGRIEKLDRAKGGYVRLAGFFEGAHAELRRQVERLYERGAEGLVLDLRGNGGGLLTEAILVSSIFVPEGVIVSTRGRTQRDRTFEAVGEALPRHPMVVLINGDTASASEIVTAALEQAGIADVAGTRSFGKGTFQEVIPLDNGGALDLTVGEYLTRDGTSINGTGIEPRVRAKDVPRTKPDEGLDRALRVLGQQL